MSTRRYPLTPRRRTDGRVEWVQPDPEGCPRGHSWGTPGTFRRAHRPCGAHAGHAEWRCDTGGCDGLVFDPSLDDTCTGPAGPRG